MLGITRALSRLSLLPRGTAAAWESVPKILADGFKTVAKRKRLRTGFLSLSLTGLFCYFAASSSLSTQRSTSRHHFGV